MSDLPQPDDELLSSALDGELTASEQADLDARLATDPALRERHAGLAAARELLTTPVTPLAGPDADRIIVAALAASDTADNVTDLSAATARRRVWPARLATAAAAVLALAIAVPALRAIDSGDDADTADSGGEAFEGALDDDGDADTANDMALESSPADAAAPSIAGLEPDDAGLDDADTGDVEMSSGGLGYSFDDLQLFRADETFDPLSDDLGDFDDTGELSQAVSQVWSGYRAPAAATTTTNADDTGPPDDVSAGVERDEFLAAARSLLDPVVFDACGSFADLVIDHFAATGDDVTSADYALARSGGDPVAVGLFRLSDDQAVLLVVDLTTCTLEDARLDR